MYHNLDLKSEDFENVRFDRTTAKVCWSINSKIKMTLKIKTIKATIMIKPILFFL